MSTNSVFQFDHQEILGMKEAKLRRVIRYLALYCIHHDTARLQKDIGSIPGVKYHWFIDVKRRIDFSSYSSYLGPALIIKTFGNVYPDVPNVVSTEDLTLCLDSIRVADLWQILAKSQPRPRCEEEAIPEGLWKVIVRTASQAARKLYFISKYDPGNSTADIVNTLLVESIRVYRRYEREGKTGLELQNYVVRSIWNASKAIIDHETSPARQRLRKSGEQGKVYETVVIGMTEAALQYNGLK